MSTMEGQNKMMTMIAATTATSTISTKEKKKIRRPSLFPQRLYGMLQNAENEGYSHIISWSYDGKSFRIDTTIADEEMILDVLRCNKFKHTQVKSFTKQLILYNFKRLYKGHYQHDFFVQHHPELFHNKSINDFQHYDRNSKQLQHDYHPKKHDHNKTSTMVFPKTVLAALSPPTTAAALETTDMKPNDTSFVSVKQDRDERRLRALPKIISPVIVDEPSHAVSSLSSYMIPTMPLYMSNQEQSDIVDRLGDLYARNISPFLPATTTTNTTITIKPTQAPRQPTVAEGERKSTASGGTALTSTSTPTTTKMMTNNTSTRGIRTSTSGSNGTTYTNPINSVNYNDDGDALLSCGENVGTVTSDDIDNDYCESSFSSPLLVAEAAQAYESTTTGNTNVTTTMFDDTNDDNNDVIHMHDENSGNNNNNNDDDGGMLDLADPELHLLSSLLY